MHQQFWVLGLLSLVSFLAGCQPSKVATPEAKPTTATAPASTIPLRVWVVAPISDSQILMRQWLAQSEQPLDLRSLTTEELLAETQANCDVLVYPARLIGELWQREWIVKLPSAAEPSLQREEDSAKPTAASTLGQAQAEYARQTLGISLGSDIPVFVSSAAFEASPTPLSWETVLAQLQVSENDAPQLEIDGAGVDREALVDRYLAIVASLSNRDPGYGMLFDLQSMKSRLNEWEYQRAAQILAALAAQPDGLPAVVGSHSAAWSWATTHPKVALAIASPTLLAADAVGIKTGNIVSVRVKPKSAGNDTRVAVAAVNEDQRLGQRPAIVAWNGGGGLLASLSSNCRQSNQASGLLRWLADPGTKSVLSTLVLGMEATTPTAGADALSWKAQQSIPELLATGGLSHEPRLPSASEYRQALADALIRFLSGGGNASQTLRAADRRWDEITAAAVKSQRRHYEQSLGLTN